MRAGALDFLEKPISSQTLSTRIREAIDHHVRQQRQTNRKTELVRQVRPTLDAAARGARSAGGRRGRSKQIARQLGNRREDRGQYCATAPEVKTSLYPSGPDQSIVIGGTAGSVAFGTVTQKAIMQNGNLTQYILPMSVLVADSAGKPVAAGTAVTVTAWPVAFSTGTYCTVDADNGVSKGTFFAEDTNENLF